MAKNERVIEAYLAKIEELKSGVDVDSEKILGKVILEQLIKDPEKYLKELGLLFYKAQAGRLKKAIEAGQKFAEDVYGEAQ